MADTTRLPDGGVSLDPRDGVLPVLPASAAGAIVRDPTGSHLVRWNGAAWVDVPSGNLYIPGQAQGDVLHFNGTIWTRLPAGTSGQVLRTLGPGANPLWVDQPPPDRFVQRTGGAVFSTSASGFQTVTGMSITPGVGDYHVLVTGEFSCDTGGNRVNLGLFRAGTSIATRQLVVETAGQYYSFAINARINVPGAGNALTLRASRVTGGAPYSVFVRDAEMQVVSVVVA